MSSNLGKGAVSADPRNESWRALLSAARAPAILVVAISIGASGCGGDDTGRKDGGLAAADAQADEDGGEDPGGTDATRCSGRPDGEACGRDRHCIAERCVHPTCGDGVRSDGEACDDGNESVGDGCDPSCMREPEGCGNAQLESGEECDDGNRIDEDACSNACKANACGNMRVDGQEECDDGNKVDDDECSNACLEVRCRNGRVDPGEKCDDGNQIDDDGCSNKCRIMLCGNAEAEDKEECDDGNMQDDDACSNACTRNECGNQRVDPGEQCDSSLECGDDCKIRKDDPCRQCEEKSCRLYMDDGSGMTGIDLVAGCYEDKPSSEFVKDRQPAPGEFSDPCKALVACSRANQCSTDGQALDACYCGSATPDECIGTSPASDAACVEQVGAATRTTDNLERSNRLSDLSYPSGWAYFLVQCSIEMCKAECAPWVE